MPRAPTPRPRSDHRSGLRCAIGLLSLAAVAGCGHAAPFRPAQHRPALPTKVVAVIPVGHGPTALATDATSIWTVNGNDETVTRTDAQTHRSVGHPIPVPGGPRAIAVGPLGAWVATAAGRAVHIDGHTLQPDATVPVPDPAGVAVGGGWVWVTSRATDNVQRIDPRSRRAVGSPIRVGSQPTDVAFAFGAVWTANSAEGTVSRIDARTGRTDATIRVTTHHRLNAGKGRSIEQPGDEVLALTAGAGALWVATTDQPQNPQISLSRIDPTTHTVNGRRLKITGGVPLRLAGGPAAVWATDTGNAIPGSPIRPAQLLRIDPTGQDLSGAPTPVGHAPGGVTVGLGHVWVANTADNTISELVPGAPG